MPGPLHIENGRVWTGDSRRPWAGSVSFAGGRVADLDAPPPPGARVIDARGGTVVPGLIDAHVHLLLGGRALSQLDLSAVKGRAAFEGAIAKRHAALPPGEWLVAGGWMEDRWPGGGRPDKSWLAAAGERPVVCYRSDLHGGLVNDAVLARLPLERDPPGGRIERDPRSGEPTGFLAEAALWQLVNPLVPEPSTESDRQALLEAQAHAHRCGLVAVGTMEYAHDVERAYRPLVERLTLDCRVILLDRRWPLDCSYGRDFARGGPLAVAGYKAFLDGTLGSRTARMIEDYDDDPGNRGLLVELAADGHLHAWAERVARAGLPPVMHAIGDEAVRLALDVVERLRRRGRGPRPRIEHAQHVDPRDFPRFAGVLVSMQPLHKFDDGCVAPRRLGSRRLAGTFAFRSLLDAGALLAFGSDWPVVPIDPLAGIRAAVTGLTRAGEVLLAAENLTVGEALRAYTLGAADALGLGDAGVLRPGARGHAVLLDRDPFTADWAAAPPEVAATIAGGAAVHEREIG